VLTWSEWRAAALLPGRAVPWREIELRAAWLAGEDPCEWRAAHERTLAEKGAKSCER